jgi:hypothetical protein
VSEEKFSKCGEGVKEEKKKITSVDFRVFEKKKELEGKFERKKMMKVLFFFKVFFGVGICALHTLGRHVVKHGYD